jgi:hypothetical protein
MINEIRINYNIAPTDKELELVGSFVFNTDNAINESFLQSSLKKSINRLQLQKHKVIVVLLDIFINDKKEYEAGLFGCSSLVKIELKKV